MSNNLDRTAELRNLLKEAIAPLRSCPQDLSGRGIVMWGGGVSGFTNAWILIRCLRYHGCELPIQLWNTRDIGPEPFDASMLSLVRPYGVECVDATRYVSDPTLELAARQQRKLVSILHCGFREVLLLDPDTIPLRDPSYLFDDEDFRLCGALFWQGLRHDPPNHKLWELLGVPYRPEPEVDLGQILLDTVKCWDALNLALCIHKQPALFSEKMFHAASSIGCYEMGTSLFRFAWIKTGLPLFVLLESPQILTVLRAPPSAAVICQSDPAGNRLFQRRLGILEWRLFGYNCWVAGTLMEPECRRFLKELEGGWQGGIGSRRPLNTPLDLVECEGELIGCRWLIEWQIKHTSSHDDAACSLEKPMGPADSVEAIDMALYRRKCPGKWLMQRLPLTSNGRSQRLMQKELRFESDKTFGTYSDEELMFWEIGRDQGSPAVRFYGPHGEWRPKISLRRINRRLWRNELQLESAVLTVSMRPLTRVYPASRAVEGTVGRDSVIARHVRRRKEKTIHLINSSPKPGDHIVSVYAAVAAADVGLGIIFHTEHAEWLRRVKHPGLTITDRLQSDLTGTTQKGVVDLNYDHTQQILHGQSRARWYAEALVPGLLPKRPRIVECGVQALRLELNNYILIAPFLCEERDRWPIQHWRRLIGHLKESGYEIVGIGAKEDERPLADICGPACAFWITGQPLNWITDAMLDAKAVVTIGGNFADLAGLLGVRTMAIHAQFPPEYLWDCTAITGVSADTTCNHCHSKADRGYSPVCDLGCSALVSISPEKAFLTFNAMMNASSTGLAT